MGSKLVWKVDVSEEDGGSSVCDSFYGISPSAEEAGKKALKCVRGSWATEDGEPPVFYVSKVERICELEF